MNVNFTPEQQAQLFKIAMHTGKAAEQLVKDGALRLLKNNVRFRVVAEIRNAIRSLNNFLLEAALAVKKKRACFLTQNFPIRRVPPDLEQH